MNKREFFEWLDKPVGGYCETQAEELFALAFIGYDFSYVPEGLSCSIVDTKGCQEGDWAGEEWCVIRCETPMGEVFFIKLWGIYASYNGTTFKGWKEVYPQTVTKVEYT